VIPLTGWVDQETVAVVTAGLQLAAEKPADNVILLLATPGGDRDAVAAIRELLESQTEMTFHAYVDGTDHRGAWGAGALLALCCDSLLIRQDCRIGASPPALEQGEWRGPAVDADMHGVLDQFGAAADAHGYPRELLAALEENAQPLWVRAGDQRPTYSVGEPTDSPDGVALKPAGRPLVLAAEVCEMLGLGTAVTSRQEVGRLFGMFDPDLLAEACCVRLRQTVDAEDPAEAVAASRAEGQREALISAIARIQQKARVPVRLDQQPRYYDALANDAARVSDWCDELATSAQQDPRGTGVPDWLAEAQRTIEALRDGLVDARDRAVLQAEWARERDRERAEARRRAAAERPAAGVLRLPH
jgi:hypothetical protein